MIPITMTSAAAPAVGQPVAGRAALRPGQPVIVGIRPGPAAAACPDSGPDSDPDGGLFGAAHNGVARLDPRADVRPGRQVTLRVDPARLYFFDPATGQAAAWPASQPAPAPA